MLCTSMDPHTVSSSNIYLGTLGNFPGTFAHLTGNEHPPQVCTLYKRILGGGGRGGRGGRRGGWGVSHCQIETAFKETRNQEFKAWWCFLAKLWGCPSMSSCERLFLILSACRFSFLLFSFNLFFFEKKTILFGKEQNVSLELWQLILWHFGGTFNTVSNWRWRNLP